MVEILTNFSGKPNYYIGKDDICTIWTNPNKEYNNNCKQHQPF